MNQFPGALQPLPATPARFPAIFIAREHHVYKNDEVTGPEKKQKQKEQPVLRPSLREAPPQLLRPAAQRAAEAVEELRRLQEESAARLLAQQDADLRTGSLAQRRAALAAQRRIFINDNPGACKFGDDKEMPLDECATVRGNPFPARLSYNKVLDQTLDGARF